MGKADIRDGVVFNLIEVDPTNVPEWCQGWPDADASVHIGYLWDGEFFRAPSPNVEQASRDVRALRDKYLAKYVDPYVGNFLRWADLHPLKQQEIIDYRRSLLDITSQTGFPLFVEWPSIPAV